MAETYSCPLCSSTFTRKANLQYHIDNQVCQKVTHLNCPHCNKELTTKQNQQYHVTHNVCGKCPPKKITLKLKHSGEGEGDGKGNTIINNHVTNTTNIMNVIVFPSEFGKENMTYIKSKLGDFIGPLIKKQIFSSIPNLFSQIHNNDQLPEYHNVYSRSEKSGYALVSDGTVFKHRPKKTIIDQIIEDKRSILNQYVDEYGEQLGSKLLKKYEKYQDELDTNSELRKTLEMEIGGLLLDMKSVIANDDKTRKLLEKVNEGTFELPGTTTQS